MIVVIVVAVDRRDHASSSAAQRRSRSSTPSAWSAERCTAAQATHLPLKINVAGVIPPIFASSILMFPAQIASTCRRRWMQKIADVAAAGRLALQRRCTSCSSSSSAFFYTSVTFNPVDVADNLKKYGGFIPGIRPGKTTARVHRARAHAHHVRRRAVPRRPSACSRRSCSSTSRCRSTSAARPAHRRRRRARHRAADRVAPDHAQLRRLHRAARVRASAAARVRQRA